MAETICFRLEAKMFMELFTKLLNVQCRLNSASCDEGGKYILINIYMHMFLYPNSAQIRIIHG